MFRCRRVAAYGCAIRRAGRPQEFKELKKDEPRSTRQFLEETTADCAVRRSASTPQIRTRSIVWQASDAAGNDGNINTSCGLNQKVPDFALRSRRARSSTQLSCANEGAPDAATSDLPS